MSKKTNTTGRGGQRPVVKNAKGGSKTGFYVAVAAIAVLGIAALVWSMRPKQASFATLDPNLPPVEAKGYVLGSPDAPVELIEFADFECPGCGQWALLTGPDVKARLVSTGQVRFRFLDYPVNDSHRNSITASLAAACGNEQGKFWEMHDLIFQTQDQWATHITDNPRGVMNRLAEQAGLDQARYTECMDAKRYQANIVANREEAARRGVNSTPSFILGGKLYKGGMGYDQLKAAVDQEIAAAGGRPAAAPAPAGASTAATPAPPAPR